MMTTADQVWLMVFYLHLALFSAATAGYAIWALHWVKRRGWLLVALNVVITLACALIVLEFLLTLGNPVRAVMLFKRNLNDVIWSTSITIIPALAKLIEFRKEHKQDARAELVKKALTGSDV